jgi:hypothetical protein
LSFGGATLTFRNGQRAAPFAMRTGGRVSSVNLRSKFIEGDEIRRLGD